MNKICSKSDCFLSGIEQNISNFYLYPISQKYRAECNKCRYKINKLYREFNKVNKAVLDAAYYKNNKDQLSVSKKEWYIKNKENLLKKSKKYHEINKVKIYKQQRVYKRKRLLNDLSFKLREKISSFIRISLKKNNSSKHGNSYLNYLPHSIRQFRDYIEHKFESWMNWDNWGVYNKETWDDNDISTWKWQLDHIIPQSDLPYISMEDDNFKKCWALENLRPLNAKQNILDGTSRIRHTKRKEL